MPVYQQRAFRAEGTTREDAKTAVCLLVLGNNKEASVACVKGGGVKDTGSQSCFGSEHVRPWCPWQQLHDFTSNEMQSHCKVLSTEMT